MNRKPINEELILRQGQVVRPFEARLISEELRARVEYFKLLLEKKSVKSRLSKKKITYRKF